VLALAVLDGKLYAGGHFTTAGDVSALRVACWDPSASCWSALGSGISGGANLSSVRALTVLDGKLYVAGHFTTAGPQAPSTSLAGTRRHRTGRLWGRAWVVRPPLTCMP